MRARSFVSELRSELKQVNEQIEKHPYIKDAESGALPLERLKLFVENQYYIVHHDMRSLALMAGRASRDDEVNYFSRLGQGDLLAFRELIKLGEELGTPLRDFNEMRILPSAVAYTHYLAWLSLYAGTGEQVAAIIINLPVWGRACGRLAAALERRYNVTSTGFLRGFAEPPGWIEEEGIAILEKYLPDAEGRVRLAAKMIQSYELGFWDALYRG
ncbi:MAG: TenA family transcriptional regulator [Nitrososphaerota archaeon]|nr:TenA family transcriptional regulator [Candidatus Calditenuaceae archaeon]MDW8073693.1 TenA family transcriptional regulator [Nitrososphaerota archaeon]